MTAKFFSLLPTAYHRYVDTFLNSNESSRLATTSQYFHASSKLPPTLPAMRQSLKKFLSHVVHGEHKQVQEILRRDIRVLLQRDTVTDCSGREFASISGFEYALWALDKHLWDDMLACLPVDEQDHLTEEDRGIVAELQRQYVQVKTQGVTYKLNGVSKTERHYDFAFINALQEQVKAQKAPGAKNWDGIDEHWRTVVGGAQRLCPMHVVDEYCSNTPFFPVPTFVARPIPANGLRHFYSWLSNVWESWFGVHSKLGVDYAIYRAVSGGLEWGIGAVTARAVDLMADLTAMKALRTTRTLDFIKLEARLESLAVEEHVRPRI